MNIDVGVLSLASLGFLTCVSVGGLIGLHLKNRVAGLGFRDNLRAMVYLTRYDAALEYHGLRRRELRARVDELRVSLGDSAADGGVLAAIHRLGPPRVLAAEVAGVRMVPSWLRGTIWLATATTVGFLVFVASSSAFLAGVDAGVAQDTTATWSTYFWTLSATAMKGGSSTVTVDFSVVRIALLLLVPFGLGARVWRLWTRKGAREHSTYAD